MNAYPAGRVVSLLMPALVVATVALVPGDFCPPGTTRPLVVLANARLVQPLR